MRPSCHGQPRLIVDDGRVVRQTVRRVLGETGLRVMQAAEGFEATREEFGIELPRVISCTKEDEPNRIIAAVEAGAQELIMKPFDAVILLGNMNDVATPPGGRT